MASIMNGRIRSIPTTTTHRDVNESLISVLPVTLPNSALSICSLKQHHPTEDIHYNCKNNDSAFHSNDRSNNDTTGSHVFLHNGNEGGVIVHQSLATGIAVKDVTTYGEVVVDHCWWNLPSNNNALESCCTQCQCKGKDDDDVKPKKENCNISILAVLAKCHNQTPTMNHASSSSSVVHLYHYYNHDVLPGKNTKEGDERRRQQHQHLASIPTSYHAIAIAMGGEGIDNGVLVISRSSGLEIHSLQLQDHLELQYQSSDCFCLMSSCGKPSLKEQDAAAAAISGQELSSESQQQPPSTPARLLKHKPTTSIGPKSLSKAFEDVSLKSVQSPNALDPFHTSILSPITDGKTQMMIDHATPVNQQQPQQQQHEHVSTPMLELLPSFCIHAMGLCYPYLQVASGDRIGVWNVSADFLFGRATNADDRGSVHCEALWADTLPTNSGSKSVHRRVTSVQMTQCGEALAISCWDGSVFVYAATALTSHDNNENQFSSREEEGGLMKAWKIVGDSSHQSEAHRTAPCWEQPIIQNTTEGLFPTFVALRLDHTDGHTSFTCRNQQGGALMMAVSTPGSNRIRCFDIFTQKQCEDIFGEKLATGEIHGLVTASNDELVWITEKDVVYSQPWTSSFGLLRFNSNHNVSTLAIMINAMKQQSKQYLIAEELTALPNEQCSKAWLKWHDASAHSNIKKPASCWAVQFKWTGLEEQCNGDIIPAPFLNKSDIIELVESRNGREAGLSTNAQAAISKNFFVVVIPTYAMIYAHSREYKSWKMIDLQECTDNIDDTTTNAKVVIYDDWCFLSVLNKRRRGVDLKVWDLASTFDNPQANESRCQPCFMPVDCNVISTVDLYPINEDLTSFAVVCNSEDEDDRVLLIWEIHIIDRECCIQSEYTLLMPFRNFKSASCKRVARSS